MKSCSKLTSKFLSLRFMFLILLKGSLGFSAIDKVLKTDADMNRLRPLKITTVKRVKGARVVLADYNLIAKDFPDLRKEPNEDEARWHARVDQMIIQQTAFILSEQTAPNDVNDKITTDDRKKTAFRPKGYNRAHVLPVPGGFVDIKGVGTFEPSQHSHSNGLASLGEMIREFVYEKLVTLIFEFENRGMRTVGNYAVVDFGFDMIHADGSRSRAGYVIRQAHVRSTNDNSRLNTSRAWEVEKVLRTYGIASSGDTVGVRARAQAKGISVPFEGTFDYLNIQGTNNSKVSEIIDFGSYIALPKFDVKILDADKTHQLGDITFLMFPDNTKFVQPNEALRVPLEQWGDFGTHDPKMDKPFVWSHELVEAWVQGRADRQAFEQHIRNLLEPFKYKLSQMNRCAVEFL